LTRGRGPLERNQLWIGNTFCRTCAAAALRAALCPLKEDFPWEPAASADSRTCPPALPGLSLRLRSRRTRLSSPLAFLAQFDCASLAPLDREGLLPKTGLLSFFYELGSQRWGYDPKDAGCARVYWFDGAPLAPAGFPVDLPEDFRLPELAAELSAGVDAPDFQDACPALGYDWTANDYRYFDAARRELGLDYPANLSKLLGWPDIIQNNMTLECELVSRGHYLGGKWESVPLEERDQLRKPSVEGWQLLFQLDTVESGGFELMFGDCGRIYFYIRNEDLAARRFDRVWLIQQCC